MKCAPQIRAFVFPFGLGMNGSGVWAYSCRTILRNALLLDWVIVTLVQALNVANALMDFNNFVVTGAVSLVGSK